MTSKISSQVISKKPLEIGHPTASTASINQLPKKIQQSILNYISPRETALMVHPVQFSWKNLLRNDGCLDLSNMKITDADLAQIIKEYKSEGKIVSINLSGCSNITDQGLKVLSQLPLQQLNLGDCHKITDNGLRFLSHLPLHQLNLAHCYKITDKGLGFLSHLPLHQLNLGHCYKITDKGLEVLSHLPLHQLNLRRCYKITDQGLEVLSHFPLQQLDLWGCSKITDQSLEMLSHLPLQQLNLDCTKITDPMRMSEVLIISNYFRGNDFLLAGSLASQSHNYSDLHKLVLDYI